MSANRRSKRLRESAESPHPFRCSTCPGSQGSVFLYIEETEQTHDVPKLYCRGCLKKQGVDVPKNISLLDWQARVIGQFAQRNKDGSRPEGQRKREAASCSSSSSPPGSNGISSKKRKRAAGVWV